MSTQCSQVLQGASTHVYHTWKCNDKVALQVVPMAALQVIPGVLESDYEEPH